jgi:hypothetical protein
LKVKSTARRLLQSFVKKRITPMEAVNVLSAPTNRPENLVEVSDLIRLSLHLTGLVQKRFRVYGYARDVEHSQHHGGSLRLQ